jgi:hypothetical protein
MEYPQEYSGRQMPCPACQQTIMFPGLASPMARSSLRLERDIPAPPQKPRSIFAMLLACIRRLINRKPVAIALISLLLVGGALAAYPNIFHVFQHAPPPMLAAVSNNDSIPVDPPDPPPAPPPDSIPAGPDSAPVAANARPASPAAPKAAKGARGARAGNNAGKQAQAGARGKTPKKAKTPAATPPSQ